MVHGHLPGGHMPQTCTRTPDMLSSWRINSSTPTPTCPPALLVRAVLTERSEKLAEDGDVDASMAALTQAERVRDDAKKLEHRYSQPDRFMEVCEVGAGWWGLLGRC